MILAGSKENETRITQQIISPEEEEEDTHRELPQTPNWKFPFFSKYPFNKFHVKSKLLH